MSKYTTQVRFICETAAGKSESVGYRDIESVIQAAIPAIFDFKFPIYDEEYRNVLCGKILKHYYMREIGAETVGLWKLWLNTRMNEIMPFYNLMYKSAMMEFDPLHDIDITTTQNKTESGSKSDEASVEDSGTNTTTTSSEDTSSTVGTTTTESNGQRDVEKAGTNGGTVKVSGNETNNRSENASESGSSEEETTSNTDAVGRKMFSDTPQGALDNVENETYLTNATKETTNSGTDGTKNLSYDNTKTVTDTNTKTTTDNTTTAWENSDSENQTYEDNSTVTNDTTVTDNKSGSVETTYDRNSGSTKKGSFTNTLDYLQSVKGKSGSSSYSKLLMEYRETFVNIDTMIINELSDLFFNLW